MCRSGSALSCACSRTTLITPTKIASQTKMHRRSGTGTLDHLSSVWRTTKSLSVFSGKRSTHGEGVRHREFSMSSPLNSRELQELSGSLLSVLHECGAAQIPLIAGSAGWDIGKIPNGLDESRQFTRRPPIENEIRHQWGQWDDALKATRLRHLAQALITHLQRKGMADRVNTAILKNGFRFENGDFVPVDASGQIPS